MTTQSTAPDCFDTSRQHRGPLMLVLCHVKRDCFYGPFPATLDGAGHLLAIHNSPARRAGRYVVAPCWSTDGESIVIDDRLGREMCDWMAGGVAGSPSYFSMLQA